MMGVALGRSRVMTVVGGARCGSLALTVVWVAIPLSVHFGNAAKIDVMQPAVGKG